jgi:hypothetical protein
MSDRVVQQVVSDFLEYSQAYHRDMRQQVMKRALTEVIKNMLSAHRIFPSDDDLLPVVGAIERYDMHVQKKFFEEKGWLLIQTHKTAENLEVKIKEF